jgi:putative methyltransferase (TIGR04325 family)
MLVETLRSSRLVRAILGGARRLLHGVKRVPAYEAFGEAGVHSYSDPDVVRVVVAATAARRAAGEPRWLSFQEAQNALILQRILASGARPLRVLDFGGACGGAFFDAERLLPGRIERWAVVDTPMMARAGRENFGSEQLQFHESLSEFVGDSPSTATEFDLIMASGVLQYLPDPNGLLLQLGRLNSRYLYLTRTLVASGTSSLFTSQISWLLDHGPGGRVEGFPDRLMSQPLAIVPLEEIIRTITETWIIQIFFGEGQCEVWRTPNGDYEVKQVGFLAERKTDAVSG